MCLRTIGCVPVQKRLCACVMGPRFYRVFAEPDDMHKSECKELCA